ncbi:MAG: phospho-sugar mutase [Actinomycetota bacterium]
MAPRIDPDLRDEVEAWIADDPDPKTVAELSTMLRENDLLAIKKCFNGLLEFGTAGLRGRVGPGPSQMNRALVSRTAAGIARYMKERGLNSVVIGRDARHGSEEFARDSAEIFAGAGMEVFLLPRPLPTPVLAFTLRDLNLDVGVMVTASHNPPEDNGYKVYLGGTVDGIRYEGSQIIAPADKEIFHEIKSIASIKNLPRGEKWVTLDESVIRRYVHSVAKVATKARQITVVYTALHGVGTETLRSVFHAAGFAEPILVSEQADPDPNFPTVAFPNPEEKGAIDLALERARDFGADLVIANDPDADRCAAAIKDDHSGSWRMLRGDEVGILLGNHIAENLAPEAQSKAIFANSIVSSSGLSKIAEHFGLRFTETLTGFKWLAKVEGLTFGYEEALGYCVDSRSVNDKDGISAALMITDLAARLKEEGSSISEYLDRIWQRIGYHATKQVSLRFDDLSLIPPLMDSLRANPPQKIEIPGSGEMKALSYRFHSLDDLERPRNGLPPTEGIRLWFEREGSSHSNDKIRMIIRPSGTEPKLKCYIEVVGEAKQFEAIERVAKASGDFISQFLAQSVTQSVTQSTSQSLTRPLG